MVVKLNIQRPYASYSSFAAEFALKKIGERLPYGGINRWDKYLELENREPGLGNGQLIALVKSRSEFHERIHEYIDSKVLLGTPCGEISAIALAELKKIDCPAEIIELKQHQFVVINRQADDETDDISSWKEAWICDPWAEKTYPASEFKLKQKEATIPFFNLRTRQIGEVTQIFLVDVKNHYLTLSGQPRIFARNFVQ